MATREFVGPIVAGILVATAAWLFLPDELELPRAEPATADLETPYVLLPHAVDDDNTSLLWFGEGGVRHPIGGPLDVHAGAVVDGWFTWSGIDWACLRAPEAPCQATGNATARAPIGPLPAATGNGTVAGDSVVVVTFMMFTSDGKLIASNGPPSSWGNFTLHGDFAPVSAKAWYLGEGRAPPGSVQVPEFRREVRDVLVGAPVGGVRASVLEEHRYDWLVDELWITARVEALG